MIITVAMLKRMNVCDKQVKLFKKIFPSGKAATTKKNLIKAFDKGRKINGVRETMNHDWFMAKFIRPNRRAYRIWISADFEDCKDDFLACKELDRQAKLKKGKKK